MNGRSVLYWIMKNDLCFEVVTMGRGESRLPGSQSGQIKVGKGGSSYLDLPASLQTDRRGFLCSFRWKCIRLFVAPVFVHSQRVVLLTVSVFLSHLFLFLHPTAFQRLWCYLLLSQEFWFCFQDCLIYKNNAELFFISIHRFDFFLFHFISRVVYTTKNSNYWNWNM